MPISLTGSLNLSGSNTLIGTKTITGSVFISGSKTIIGTTSITGSLLVTGSLNTVGTITATTLVVQTITSSVDFVTGSTRFGSILGNTHVFSGSVTMNPNGLFVSSSGNVGIGTISPTDIAGFTSLTIDNSASGPLIDLNNSGTNNMRLLCLSAVDQRIYGAGNLSFYTSGSNRMSITSTGNVGIGTSTPQALLQITSTAFPVLKVADAIGGGAVALGDSAITSNYVGIWRGVANSISGGGFLNIQGNGIAFMSSDNVFGAGSERMRIASNGLVNINNVIASSTNYKLGVSGSAYINGSNGKGIFVTDGASYASIVGLNSAISAYNSLELRASGTDGQLYLTTGGNISMGSLVDAGFRLYVKQTTGGIYVEAGSTSSHKALQCNSADGGTIFFFVRGDGLINTGLATYSPYNFSLTGRACYINSSGELGYLSSTRESKANIESIKNVNFINQLNPVQFNYRKKNSETNEYTDEFYDNTNYGFIADEVEKINKDLVFYKNDGTTLAGVEYNNIIAILTKAIQELTARVQYLENK
jgi:hypothetical protein